MCQYDTQAAMAAMTAAAQTRAPARPRWCTGTREISSTVSSSARGGHAAMVWLMRLSRACSTLAAIEAATPRTRVSRTIQRMRRRWVGLFNGYLRWWRHGGTGVLPDGPDGGDAGLFVVAGLPLGDRRHGGGGAGRAAVVLACRGGCRGAGPRGGDGGDGYLVGYGRRHVAGSAGEISPERERRGGQVARAAQPRSGRAGACRRPRSAAWRQPAHGPGCQTGVPPGSSDVRCRRSLWSWVAVGDRGDTRRPSGQRHRALGGNGGGCGSAAVFRDARR